MINLYAAGELRRRLSLFGCRWYLPTVVVAEALYVHIEQADGTIEKSPIDLQSFVDDGTLLSCTAESAEELELYVDLATGIGDGEAMALAIAKSRGWTLLTDDRKARRIADGLAIGVLTTPELIKRWADSTILSCDELRDTLRLIEDRASFFPAVSHPLHSWWRDSADG
jgi:predicted nucleic acid-binding protein